MTPELQQLLQQMQAQQQQAMQSAQSQMVAAQKQFDGLTLKTQIIGYSSYAALLTCAVFAVLCFWRLSQIRNALLRTSAQPPGPLASLPSASGAHRPPTPQVPVHDDSRYLPRQ